VNAELHQSQLAPADNKFHIGNGSDGLHYWIKPPEIYLPLDKAFKFDFDPCPFPLPPGFDGLTCEWGQSNWVNPPFGSIPPPSGKGRKIGATGWMRKAILEQSKGKTSVIVHPLDKWVLLMIAACGGASNDPLYDSKREIFDEARMLEQLAAGRTILNLGDVRWLATEDGSQGKGTGRHIAAFILRGVKQ
jgi:hypothetical protein